MPRFEGIPDLIYGTAFKFETSRTLVAEAFKAGFRAIDTAGNGPQYREKLVGDAIKSALAEGSIKREELWVQTKFSPFKQGKDPALYPYDVNANIVTRVKQSVESSLENLGVEYIDCLVLHSLYPTLEETLETWKIMESYVPSKVSCLGVSNTDLTTLGKLFDAATIKPSTVQNRLTEDIASRPNPQMPSNLPYPEDPYDLAVRRYCFTHGITYTPWGLLWGNPTLLEEMDVFDKMATETGVTKEVAFYLCMRSLAGCKVSILCGTRKVERMSETIQGFKRIEEYLTRSEDNRKTWKGYVNVVQDVMDGHTVPESANHEA
ncbi:NADP-dependent oxidoreductase domain-containing protein [Xylariales sp. AK1849]|nr:NADP-dependent oxidoreductase domain-containing protein [Xylariales sp. AK1849]